MGISDTQKKLATAENEVHEAPNEDSAVGKDAGIRCVELLAMAGGQEQPVKPDISHSKRRLGARGLEERRLNRSNCC